MQKCSGQTKSFEWLFLQTANSVRSNLLQICWNLTNCPRFVSDRRKKLYLCVLSERNTKQGKFELFIRLHVCFQCLTAKTLIWRMWNWFGTSKRSQKKTIKFSGDLRWVARFGLKWAKSVRANQSTYRQHLPKVCVQQFHGQDEDWFGIF